MTLDFDPSTFILEQFESMSAADRCRMLDMLHQVVGPCAPVAAFEDIGAEARDWAACCDDKTLTIYFDAIAQRWLQSSPGRVSAAASYLNGKARPGA